MHKDTDPWDDAWADEFWTPEWVAAWNALVGEDIRAGHTSRVYDDTGEMFADLEAGR